MKQSNQFRARRGRRGEADLTARDRGGDSWSQFSGQMRARWGSAADTMGEALCNAGRQIQAAGHAAGDDARAASGWRARLPGRGRTAAKVNQTLRKSGKLAQEQLAGAAEGLIEVIAATGKRKQEELSDSLATLSESASDTTKRAAEELSDKTKDLSETFGKAGKAVGVRLGDTAGNLGDTFNRTAKRAPTRLAALGGVAGGLFGRRRKGMRRAGRRGQKMAAQAGKFLAMAEAGKMIRSMLTRRQATRRRRNMGFSVGWLAALGLGAGLMYYFDPRSGTKRRAQMRTQIDRLRNPAADQGYGYLGQDLEAGPGLESGRQEYAGYDGQAGTGWPRGVRLVASLAGGMLTVSGISAGGFMGAARSAAGLGLMALGITRRRGNMSQESLRSPGAIDVHKTLRVNAPVHEVFNFWRRFENFPRFMSHVIEVHDLGGNRSHWVVEGPAGAQVSWDALTTRMISNSQIGWQSEPGSTIGNTGSVHFSPLPEGGTLIDIHMTYQPPAGALGHAVAAFFGSDPGREMDDDLARFQALAESGKTWENSQPITRPDMLGE